MLNLTGRTALVTGGGRGIGRAITLMLARLGARVGVNYRNDEAAAGATVEAVRVAGGVAVALAADVSIPEEARRLIAETESRLGPLDVLVVNHGIWVRASIEAMTPAEWSETLSVNLGGAYALCHEAAQVMIPRKRGTIVTIASTAGQRGEPHYSHYAASKGGLIAFTKSLAAELAPHGIRVNGVSPGAIDTWSDRVATDPALGAGGAATVMETVAGAESPPAPLAR